VEPFQARIGDVDLQLTSHPQLFSPRKVDVGTLAMLKCVSFETEDKVLDLGCGCGVVGIYAAKQIGVDRVFLTDRDPVAVEVAAGNANANGVAGLSVCVSDGFREFFETGFTKILCNPPYHTDFSVAKHFIMKGFNRLQIGGELFFVTKREKWYRNKLAAVFGGARAIQVDGYVVTSAIKKSESYARKR